MRKSFLCGLLFLPMEASFKDRYVLQLPSAGFLAPVTAVSEPGE